MEYFPSMSYEQVMAMPFKEYKTLFEIRRKRKIEEQQKFDADRKAMEERNKREMNKNSKMK